MLFVGNSDVKCRFIKLILRILHMAELEVDLPDSRISIETISKLVNLKVIKSYLSDFLEYGRYDYEEA